MSNPKNNSNILPPWLNEKGEIKSDIELREISKSWRPSQWEEYLQSLERGQTELILETENGIENFSDEAMEDYLGLIFSTAAKPKNKVLKEAVDSVLKELSPRQRQVLRMVFWNSFPERKVAEELKIGRRTVRKALERGLDKIRKLIFEKKVQRRLPLTKKIAAHSPPKMPPLGT